MRSKLGMFLIAGESNHSGRKPHFDIIYRTKTELKNGTAPRRVKQKSSVIAHFDHRKNVFNVQLRFLNFIHRKVA